MIIWKSYEAANSSIATLLGTCENDFSGHCMPPFTQLLSARRNILIRVPIAFNMIYLCRYLREC